MDVLEEFFPSKHLKASDLKDKEVRVTIARVEKEKLGDDVRPVVYFNGKEKGVALNKGNTTTLAEAFGRDSNNWFGREVILLSVWTDYQGKPVQGIRIRIPVAVNVAPVRPPHDPISSGLHPNGYSGRDMPAREGGGPVKPSADMSDDIPFAPEFR